MTTETKDQTQQRIDELEGQAQESERLASMQDLGGLTEEEIRYRATQASTIAKEAESARAKAGMLRTYQQQQQQIEATEKRAKSPDWKVDTEALSKAKEQSAKQGEALLTLTSKEMAPYVTAEKDGTYSVDVIAARKAGVSREMLAKSGVDPNTIFLAEQSIKRGDKPVTKEQAKKEVAAKEFVGRQESARFKRINTKLPDGNWISNTDLQEVKEKQPSYYEILTKQGYEAYKGELEKIDKAMDAIEKHPYMITVYDDKGNPSQKATNNIDTVAAIKAGKEDALRLVYGEEAVTAAKEHIKQEKEYEEYLKTLPNNWAEAMWRGLTPWEEERGEKASIGGGLIMAAEMLVPGVFAARHWNELNAGDKAFTIAVDVLCLIPLATAAARGAQAVGTAGRTARLVGALKGVGAESLAMLRAPVDIILHPVEAAKAPFRTVREFAENVLHPKKIPEAVITTSEGTVRLRITETTSAKQAIAIRDTLMDLARKGERPVIEIGGIKYELAQSSLMKEAGGGLVHATPTGEAFETGLTVAEKPGMSITEQGLFLSHEPLPRFTSSSAFGTKGEKGYLRIFSPEEAAKAIPTTKLYRGFAEMEMKFAVGEPVEKATQALFTRTGVLGDKVIIGLSKPLSAGQIIKLKALGLVEVLKAPFSPAITVSGKVAKAERGMSAKQVDTLIDVLKESDNLRAAKEFERIARLSMSARRGAPTLSRIAGIAERAARVRATDISSLLYQPPRRLESVAGEKNRVRLEVLDDLSRIITEQQRLQRIRKVPSIIRAKESARERAVEAAERPKEERPSKAKVTEEKGRAAKAEEAKRVARPERGKVTEASARMRLTEKEKRQKPFLPSGASDKEKRQVIKDAGGAIAWYQGRVGKKDRWDTIIHPFKDNQDYMMILGEPPKGATIVTRGKGSPYATAQVLYGKPPSKEVLVDSGFQDVRVIPKGGKKIRLEFSPDPEGETKGDITIGGNRITERVGAISNKTPRISRKVTRITPKTPRLR